MENLSEDEFIRNFQESVLKQFDEFIPNENNKSFFCDEYHFFLDIPGYNSNYRSWIGHNKDKIRKYIRENKSNYNIYISSLGLTWNSEFVVNVRKTENYTEYPQEFKNKITTFVTDLDYIFEKFNKTLDKDLVVNVINAIVKRHYDT